MLGVFMRLVENSRLLRVLDEVEKTVKSIRWILKQLMGYEKKYGMSTGAFIKKWRNGEIEEPDDPEKLEELLNWDGLFEILNKRLEELRSLVEGLR